MRLIDADELIEHVWRDKLDSRELIAEMIEKAPTIKEISTKIPIDVFEKLISQEPKTEWIPVSERLPEVMDGSNGECSDDVLICVADDEQITISTGFYGYYPKSISNQGWWSMWAYGCHQLDSKYKVIAWMPLPKPYEEG